VVLPEAHASEGNLTPLRGAADRRFVSSASDSPKRTLKHHPHFTSKLGRGDSLSDRGPELAAIQPWRDCPNSSRHNGSILAAINTAGLSRRFLNLHFRYIATCLLARFAHQCRDRSGKGSPALASQWLERGPDTWHLRPETCFPLFSSP